VIDEDTFRGPAALAWLFFSSSRKVGEGSRCRRALRTSPAIEVQIRVRA
jgi:hypothetical protein